MYQWSEIFDMPADRLGDNEDGVTLFAPTDEAFDALDPALLAVLDDPDVINPVLYDLLAHHYMVRLYPSSQFEAGPQETFRTSPSGPVVLETDPLTWGGHPVIETDMRAGNGYIHVVDGVVIPDNLMEAAAGEAE